MNNGVCQGLNALAATVVSQYITIHHKEGKKQKKLPCLFTAVAIHTRLVTMQYAENTTTGKLSVNIHMPREFFNF